MLEREKEGKPKRQSRRFSNKQFIEDELLEELCEHDEALEDCPTCWDLYM